MNNELTLIDPFVINRFEQTLNSYLLSGDRLQRTQDPRRSINDDCGFPETSEVDARYLKDLYDRSGTAYRVVTLFPDESWSSFPTVAEDLSTDTNTKFEKSFNSLDKQLLGSNSKFKQDGAGGNFWKILRRLDRLAGIGHFGALLIGLNDSDDFSTPAPGFNEKTGLPDSNRGDAKLLYLKPLDETQIYVDKWNDDVNSPRYNQPEEYNVHINAYSQQQNKSTASMIVHWSRVIHIADDVDSDETWAIPRLLPVLNNVLSLRKLLGGSAEMYWKGAFPGLMFETHPELGGDVEVDEVEMKSRVEEWMNTLQRYMLLKGMSGKSIAPQVVDPSKQIEVQIDEICIKMGVPKRIFIGSERGELSSSQDKNTWDDRMKDRQEMFITPDIIVPTIDRLVHVGVLEDPAEYSVSWNRDDKLNPTEAATVAKTRAEALSIYIQGDIQAIMTPKDFLVRELQYTEEEADGILEKTLDSEEFVDIDETESPVSGEEDEF